jgi:hypothetical protein
MREKEYIKLPGKKYITLPIGKCSLVLHGIDPETGVTIHGGGDIITDWHEISLAKKDIMDETDLVEEDSRERYNSAIDGIEALVLAMGCAGIDLETPAMLEAIETAIDNCANNC